MRFAFRPLLILILFCGAAIAQQQINPVTQIRWPLITGAGTPTAVGAVCNSTHYGQPYQDTAVTPNTVYTCGTDGWAIRTSVVPVNFRGNWDPVVTYSQNDAVFYSGSTYVSIQNNNLNQNPSTQTAFWVLFSQGASAAGGNFAVQYANNAALAGANFNGFVFNNSNASPPSAATQGQAYALLGGTPALLAQPNPFTVSGAANQPAASWNGTIFAGGSTTSTKPLVLIETAGLPSAGWDIKGTAFGINVPTTPAFAGNVFDFQVNGVSAFRMSSNGSIQLQGPFSANGIQANQSITAGGIFWGVTGAGNNPVFNMPLGVSVVIVDATLFPVTVNLPTLPQGQEFVIKKIDATGNAVTVNGNTHTIDGAATQIITAQWGVLRITALGGITPNWYLF